MAAQDTPPSPVRPFTNLYALEKRWIGGGGRSCLDDPFHTISNDLTWGVVTNDNLFQLTDFGMADPRRSFAVMFGTPERIGESTMRNFVDVLPRNVWLQFCFTETGFAVKLDNGVDVAVYEKARPKQ